MTASPGQPAMNAQSPKPYRRLGLGLFLAAAGLLAFIVLYYVYYYPMILPSEQPIPFSHRVHAGHKTIGCLMCHDGVADSRSAGIPPVQRCMLCHEKIIIEHPKIKELREHYFTGQPILWTRVGNLPDYVRFDHQVHIRRGFDCSACHGDVKAMDRVALAHDFRMGFCLGCHRAKGATHDCMTCHH